MRKLLTISILTLGLLIFLTKPASGEETQNQCFTRELVNHGVRRRDARKIVPELERASERNRSAESVGIRAYRLADRASNDRNWIEWAAWVAQNAYEQCTRE